MIKYILFWMAKPISEMAIYLVLVVVVVVLIVLAKIFDWLNRKL